MCLFDYGPLSHRALPDHCVFRLDLRSISLSISVDALSKCETTAQSGAEKMLLLEEIAAFEMVEGIHLFSIFPLNKLLVYLRSFSGL